ncbi:urease accessory protein UreD [Acidithiobacillus sp. M4-SHS-6]|uniref:urease accessory protein UreD n=1 Tax=Acidithiobacillus sp. M4-SHS-6 TaxID=3383024 RepID=UPI0039BDF703
MTEDKHGHPRWEGHLQLRFERRQNQTRLSHQFVAMPLAFQKVYYPEGDQVCHGVMLHPSGGVAKDDQLLIRADLGPAAEVLLTTPGAGKVYRSADRARQQVHLQLDSGACLEWFPQESIVFDGAQVQNHLQVELAEESSWFGWDVWRLGRSGAGERFTHGSWQAVTEVWREGRPLWVDRQQLRGGSGLLDSPYGLNGQSVLGTMAFLGQPVSRDLLETCREAGQAAIGQGDWALSRLEFGLVARYRGASSARARSLFVAIWGILRKTLRQRTPCIPRIWNT